MFKSENDKPSARLGITTPLDLEVNASSTVMQCVIETDATVGTLTFSVKTRRSTVPEPVFRADDTTQVIVDLSTTERTIVFEEGIAINNIIAAVSGLNGTFYKVTASSGDR